MFSTLIPWIELRGSIPLAVSQNAYHLIPGIIILNILLFIPIWLFLNICYNNIGRKIQFIEKIVEGIHQRSTRYVKKYGILGITLFVAIPLPGSGIYSGTLAAWLLNLKKKNAFMACGLGVLIAGMIVFILSEGVKSILII